MSQQNEQCQTAPTMGLSAVAHIQNAISTAREIAENEIDISAFRYNQTFGRFLLFARAARAPNDILFGNYASAADQRELAELFLEISEKFAKEGELFFEAGLIPDSYYAKKEAAHYKAAAKKLRSLAEANQNPPLRAACVVKKTNYAVLDLRKKLLLRRSDHEGVKNMLAMGKKMASRPLDTMQFFQDAFHGQYLDDEENRLIGLMPAFFANSKYGDTAEMLGHVGKIAEKFEVALAEMQGARMDQLFYLVTCQLKKWQAAREKLEGMLQIEVMIESAFCANPQNLVSPLPPEFCLSLIVTETLQ